MSPQASENSVDEQDPLLGKRPTINPYLKAAGLVSNRLSWDLNPEAWRSRAKLRKWQDKYKGQKAVILCNGPSLLKTDFTLLRNVFCFGLNKINLLFDKSDFRPQCVVVVNPFVIEQNAGFYNKTNLPIFIDSFGLRRKVIASKKNITFLHSGGDGFARDCSISVSQGFTVTYVAMQLAFHMGFDKVALVGADHNFTTKGPANKTVVAGGRDDNHFDPTYFSGGVKWQLPDLFESEVAYTRARKTYESFGRMLVNSTDGGCLEVFDRVNLSGFLAL